MRSPCVDVPNLGLAARDMCLSASGRYLALSGFLGVSVIAIGHAQPSVYVVPPLLPRSSCRTSYLLSSLKRETQTTLICFSQDESRIAAVDINGLVEVNSDLPLQCIIGAK